jgi:hypothetical protein
MSNIHLRPRSKLWINCVGAGVWISGAAWLIARYVVKSQDALGLQNTSSEVWWLRVHGAFAFLALWTGGLLWGVHVVRAWKRGHHRWSGGALFTVLSILIVTGYLLYYVGNEGVRDIISWIHWILGLAIPVAYLIHRVARQSSRPGVHPGKDS